MTLATDETIFENDHSALDPGEQIVADFTLPDTGGSAKEPVSIFIRALVTRSGDSAGDAPIYVYCNDQAVVQDFTMPGGGFQPDEVSLQIPPAALVKGKNEIRLFVSAQAQNEFWLYRVGVGTTMSSVPDMADFTVMPSKVHGMILVADGTTFDDGHSILDVSQQVIADFTLPKSTGAGKSKQASIFIRALVTRLGDTTPGYAPVSLYCNGQIFVQDFTLPGEGFQPEETSFQIPPGLLVDGKNEVTLLVSSNARSVIWIYSMGIMPGMPY
jgi:hypothetical protein